MPFGNFSPFWSGKGYAFWKCKETHIFPNFGPQNAKIWQDKARKCYPRYQTKKMPNYGTFDVGISLAKCVIFSQKLV